LFIAATPVQRPGAGAVGKGELDLGVRPLVGAEVAATLRALGNGDALRASGGGFQNWSVRVVPRRRHSASSPAEYPAVAHPPIVALLGAEPSNTTIVIPWARGER
jgi:hypothetical protein